MYMFNMSGLFPCFSFGRVTPVYTRIASRGHALSEEEELREANLYARELSCIICICACDSRARTCVYNVRGQRAMYTYTCDRRMDLHCVLFWLWSLHSVRASLTRDDIVRNYFNFKMGFPYNLILCFLVAIHGIYIFLSTRRAGASA